MANRPISDIRLDLRQREDEYGTLSNRRDQLDREMQAQQDRIDALRQELAQARREEDQALRDEKRA